MKKLLLFTLLVLMVLPMVFGEQSQDKKYVDGLPDLIPYRKGDKWVAFEHGSNAESRYQRTESSCFSVVGGYKKEL